MRAHPYSRLLALLVLAASVLAGCDSSDSDVPNDAVPPVGGFYTATQDANGSLSTYQVDVAETEGGAFSLSGTLVVVRPGLNISVPITGEGTYTFPNISMDLSFTVAGVPTLLQISGTVNASGDTLTLTSSDGTTLTFRRQ